MASTNNIKKGDVAGTLSKAHNTTLKMLELMGGIDDKDLEKIGSVINALTSGGTASGTANNTTVNSAIKNAYTVNTNKIKTGANALAPSGSKTVNSKTLANSIKKWESAKPKDDSGRYDKQIDKLINTLTGMKFSYDPSEDVVYKMVSDANRKNARLAMDDTLGKLLPRSGGYGNTYAQAAAQQAFAGELSKTVDMIPELYEAAYSRFDTDRDALSDSIELLTGYSDSEFSKYNDLMKLYLSEGDMLFDNYNTLSKDEYDRFLDYAELLENAAKINNQRFK